MCERELSCTTENWPLRETTVTNNNVTRDPIVNSQILAVPTQALDNTGLVQSALDMVTAHGEHVLLVASSAWTTVTAAFVVVEESNDQVVWKRLVTLKNRAADVIDSVAFSRKRRYLRVSIVVEGTSSAYTVTVVLIS